MSARGQRIHVVKNRTTGEWETKPEGKRPTEAFATQAEAIDRVRKDLQNAPNGGEAIIHRGDNNRIREAYTINRTDPHPPKG